MEKPGIRAAMNDLYLELQSLGASEDLMAAYGDLADVLVELGLLHAIPPSVNPPYGVLPVGGDPGEPVDPEPLDTPVYTAASRPDPVLLFHLSVGTGEATTDIWVHGYINEAGDLVIAGQDVGAAPKAWFGDTDYEYWLTVGAPHKDRVLLELLVERFGGGRGTSEIREWFESKSIPVGFSSY